MPKTQSYDAPLTLYTSEDASDCKGAGSPIALEPTMTPSRNPKYLTSCMTRIEGLCQAKPAGVEDSQLSPEALKKRKRLAKNRATASISRQVT